MASRSVSSSSSAPHSGLSYWLEKSSNANSVVGGGSVCRQLYGARVSWASNDGVRRSMRSNRASGTRPELRLRSALHRRGLRFRVQFRVPGAPRSRIDIAFTRARVAVYLDGCFWHGCPAHPFQPKRNAEYWAQKFAANRRRDADTNELLRAQGWLVLRFWDHEPLLTVVEAIEHALVKRRVDRDRITD